MRLSLCMIVKNEEQQLERCLTSVQSLVDEIIIVDTGSTDDTKKVAGKFTDKVFDFTWCDDFAAARNESLKHATGDWILVLDADETLEPDSFEKLKTAIQSTEHAAYSMPQIHYTNTLQQQTGFIALENHQFKGYFVSWVVRLFKNEENLKFQYCVHETIKPSLQRANLQKTELDVPIHHFQELKGPENLEVKQEFYFRLSLNNIKQYPNYAKSYSDAAVYLASQGKQAKALPYARKAWELEPAHKQYLLNLLYRLRDAKKFDEAVTLLSSALQKENDPYLQDTLGSIYFEQGDFVQAKRAFEKGLLVESPLREQLKKNLHIVKHRISREPSQNL